MAVSLYDLSVASYLQVLPAVEAFLKKGQEHFAANKADADAVADIRLAPDMLPLRFQVHSVVHHSQGAIAGIKAGLFTPPPPMPKHGYAGLVQQVADARAALEKVTPDEVEALSGRDMTFAMGELKIPFTVETFLLSFSLPNFYFHAATAYDILRAQGVPLGKRDFLGRMRIKR